MTTEERDDAENAMCDLNMSHAILQLCESSLFRTAAGRRFENRIAKLCREHRDLQLRAVIEEASEMGAQRALTRIGLSDADAGEDIEELRELLGAWRAAKKSAVKSVMFNALSTTTTGGEGLRDLLTRALSKCHMARPAKQGS